ncbi:MAG: hypothetical protein GXO87_14800 [Chlorobi bacterium]|nr:hypothetical protein [Chlorobiota bacterium]
MKKQKSYYYITPGVIAFLIFISNFLSSNIFGEAFENFAVWFVISVFIFASGWFMNNTFGYITGGKILFAVIVAATAVSVLMVFIFKEYFNVSNLLVESLILYSLRNIFLGAMGFYGLALNENMILQKEVESLKAKNVNVDRIIDDAKKESSIIVADAKIKAERLIFKAQKNSTNVVEMKNTIERNLKQFIQTERELIRKYEKEDF